MSLTCTRCQGTGFLNLHQLPDGLYDSFSDPVTDTRLWMEEEGGDHDVSVCDCCGNGVDWHGTPGEHYNKDDPRGNNGPYTYNGGLCECN